MLRFRFIVLHLLPLVLIFKVHFAYGQDCSVLEQLATFHGIRVGSDITGKFATQYFPINHKPLDHYSFQSDKVASSSFLSQFFLWDNCSFSGILFSCVPETHLLYSICVVDTLNALDWEDISNGNYPKRFLDLKGSLTTLLGAPTSIELDTTSDKLPLNDGRIVPKGFGNTLKVTWGCEKFKLVISYTIGASENSMNGIAVNIVECELEKRVRIYQLTH